MGSADTMGRVHAQMDTEGLRKGLHQIYARLKRNKALSGMTVAVLDGHETHSSYRRHCAGCLRRTVRTEAGDRTQYYHRHVALMLLGKKLRLLLDMEPQRVGEDEVATALRVVRSRESYWVRRQLTGELVQEKSEWMWVTTLSPSQATTDVVV